MIKGMWPLFTRPLPGNPLIGTFTLPSPVDDSSKCRRLQAQSAEMMPNTTLVTTQLQDM